MKRRLRGRHYIYLAIAIVCIIMLLYKAPSAGFGVWLTNSNKDIRQNTDTTESKRDIVQNLRVRTENTYIVWQSLIEDTAFSDLCSEVYARQLEEIADEFIQCYNEFDELDGEATTIENYAQYEKYFSTYRFIGESLQEFTEAIRNSRYEEALDRLKELRSLNREIPVIS